MPCLGKEARQGFTAKAGQGSEALSCFLTAYLLTVRLDFRGSVRYVVVGLRPFSPKPGAALLCAFSEMQISQLQARRHWRGLGA